MYDDIFWLDRAEVSPSFSPSAWLCLSLPGKGSSIMRSVGGKRKGDGRLPHRLRMHPLLYEYFTSGRPSNEEEMPPSLEGATSVLVLPLPLAPCSVDAASPHRWTVQAIEDLPILPAHSTVSLQVLYALDTTTTDKDVSVVVPEADWVRALAHRAILRGSVLLLQLPFHADDGSSSLYFLLRVLDIHIPGATVGTSSSYQVGAEKTYSVHIRPYSTRDTEGAAGPCAAPCSFYGSRSRTWTDGSSSFLAAAAAGYESIVSALRSRLEFATHPAAPTGLLLTGPAGIGKTHLVRALMTSSSKWKVQYLSVQEILLNNSNLPSLLTFPTNISDTILVLDDLQLLAASTETTEPPMEHRRVWNDVLQILDERRYALVIGIAQEAAALPPELVRAGRLEWEVPVPPPTQVQREAILYHFLRQASDSDAATETHEHWARLLATVTAGCVARDLRSLCANAWSNALSTHSGADAATWTWEHLAEAARNITPSQLAMLDVTKPANYLDVCSLDDWPRIHQLSWNALGGYSAVKQGVYRTVVVPWRRQMRADRPSATVGTMVPPSGVLFHGPSGCGKTIAARCLGSSLGLPMIQVRASDVLDQWLGGSEATLRSLFARARSAAPCILFLDELDALASNRSHSDGSDVMSRLLSTFLNELDGVTNHSQTNVLVVACTNRIHMLDAALLRPGRLEEHILLPLPSMEDILAIIEQTMLHAPVDASVNWTVTARHLADRSASCADVEGMCREAMFRAMRRCSRDDTTIVVRNEDIACAITAMKLSEH